MKNNQQIKSMIKILNHHCNYGTVFDKYDPKQNGVLQKITVVTLNNLCTGNVNNE